MRIKHLSLSNFRNYSHLALELPPGPSLLYGSNGQGKTNLLEAIYYLATTRPARSHKNRHLINWAILNSEEPIVVGRVVADLETATAERRIEMRLIRENRAGQISFRRQALVDRRKVRLIDLIGKLRVVLFMPQDLEIISGSPSTRRRYLDVALCQIDPAYCRTLTAYNKVLEQRNALLRRISESGNGRDVLPIYSDQLIELGAELFVKRASWISALSDEASRIYQHQLTAGGNRLRLAYLPRLISGNLRRHDESGYNDAVSVGEWLHNQTGEDTVAERFASLLSETHSKELAAGTTLMGPHRDDWRFWRAGRDLADYGSRGQQRGAILALKLAEVARMAAATGDTPVLLLDEVASELDKRHRELLMGVVDNMPQALLTAADRAMFGERFLSRATTLRVENGQVARMVDRSPSTTS